MGAVVCSSFGAPKNLPRGEGADGVGGRGNAEGNGDRGTNGDGVKSCVFSSSVSTSAATFPMGEGLVRRYLNDTTIATVLEWLRKSCCLSEHSQHAEHMEAVRAPRALLPVMLCISVRAEHAMRDLIASNAPLRRGRHKARQNGPKHYPGDPMGPAGPLACLSPLSFFKQRKMVPPEGLPKRECK